MSSMKGPEVMPLFQSDGAVSDETCTDMAALVRRQLALLGEDP